MHYVIFLGKKNPRRNAFFKFFSFSFTDQEDNNKNKNKNI